MWNTITKFKVVGTAALCRMQLEGYLHRHEHIVVYDGQDVRMKEKGLKDLNRDNERDQLRKQQIMGTRQTGKETAVVATLSFPNPLPWCILLGNYLVTEGYDRDGEPDLQRKRNLGTDKVPVTKHQGVPLVKAHSTAHLLSLLPVLTKLPLLKPPKERDQMATKNHQKPSDLPQPFASQPPRKSVTLVHPHAYIALAQKVWESEAAYARGLQMDSHGEIEQLKKIQKLRRWYRENFCIRYNYHSHYVFNFINLENNALIPLYGAVPHALTSHPTLNFAMWTLPACSSSSCLAYKDIPVSVPCIGALPEKYRAELAISLIMFGG